MGGGGARLYMQRRLARRWHVWRRTGAEVGHEWAREVKLLDILTHTGGGAKWRSAWHARPRHLLGAAPTRGTLLHDKTSFTVCDAVPEIETTPAAGKQKAILFFFFMEGGLFMIPHLHFSSRSM